MKFLWRVLIAGCLGLMLATGLRIGEALGLQWSDVDANYRELRVRRQLVEVNGVKPYFGEPKSASSKRVVPVIPAATSALHAQRARYLERRLYARELWQENDLVFSDELGAAAADRR